MRILINVQTILFIYFFQSSVKEARVKELKFEMLNSQKLKAHFEDNPRERELLKHDKVCIVGGVQAYSHKTQVTY